MLPILCECEMDRCKYIEIKDQYIIQAQKPLSACKFPCKRSVLTIESKLSVIT